VTVSVTYFSVKNVPVKDGERKPLEEKTRPEAPEAPAERMSDDEFKNGNGAAEELEIGAPVFGAVATGPRPEGILNEVWKDNVVAEEAVILAIALPFAFAKKVIEIKRAFKVPETEKGACEKSAILQLCAFA
jgi:hypothetical protein